MKLKGFALAPLAIAMLMAGGDAVAAAADATVAKKKKCAPNFARVKVKGKLKCRSAPEREAARATLS
jgi:hypothetical protein